MREKIVKQKETKSRRAGRFFCLLLCAVILGAVAAVSFVVSVPLAEKYLKTEEPTTAVAITIEKDDEPGTTGSTVETEAAMVPEETLPVTEPAITDEDDVREIVKEELGQITWTQEKVRGFNQILTEVGASAEHSIVTVSSVKQQVDWFDNPVESAGQYTGVILAVNPTEIAILTGEAALKDADALRVVFHDGTTAEGVVKMRDSKAGMAVISVDPTGMSQIALDNMKVMTLGNSYSVKNGDLVIAVGSPAGLVYSVKTGNISYVAKGVQMIDGQSRVFYTDIACNEEMGTYFLNLSGQLIGWATDGFYTVDRAAETMIMPISEYKGVLQKLSNGVEVPYFGITGREVSAAMEAEGIPKGIYLTESIAEGPAYAAGIQNGDILTKMQGDEIHTIRDFQSKLESMQSGEEIVVTIERKGIDVYKEIEYRVTIGAR